MTVSPAPAVMVESGYLIKTCIRDDRAVTVTLSLTYTAALPHPLPVETQLDLHDALGTVDFKSNLTAQIDALIRQAAGA
ncbi:hypothetical protein [Deinococcus sp. QL22]|uniref:hypothetical protein n=1 Tax=Deinococcus sp. QL22 TaxID=2939437 RepID=UPI002017A82E|nr:hypothetical protein [Deinococcus sp. QL22]UQN10294.1 hypothetical protein M1R55_29525 [Deinococcus sp. QL22]UQN10428.1 hypothetical protein M1R55_28850 [Deinococcus sp. QL22]